MDRLKALIVCVCLLAAADAGMAAVAVRWRARLESGPLVGRQIPPPRGALTAWPACEVLRYSALGCPFCSARAAARWRKFAGQAAGAGCRIAEIAPWGGGVALDGLRLPHQILLTVTPRFAAQARLSRTPTTLLILRGRVAWEDVGVGPGPLAWPGVAAIARR